MNLTADIEQEHAFDAKELSDFHPLVIAKIVVEWARIDRNFPMQAWGHEYVGTHVRVESVKYYIGYNAQQAEHFLQLTAECEKRKAQKTWRIWIKDLQAYGMKAELTPQ